jgi:hypothetical protein
MRSLNITWALSVVAFASLALACGDDDMPGDGGMVDAPATDGPQPDRPPPPPGLCEDYCTAMEATCGTAALRQYADMADCMDYCMNAGWPEGTEGEMAGNTLQCRIYHVGVAATMMPEMHCPHAGPSGADVCGSVAFRTDAADAFTRVDRMGMPAVSTALVSSAMKEAFNNADPAMDATFAGELVAGVGALHTALDDDLAALNLETCDTDCASQEIATGVTVASLVIPDTLQLTEDSTGSSSFPNGRSLDDPVIDIVLSVILLRMGGTCPDAGTPCSPATLVGTNPTMNDETFSGTFPYLAPAHTP